MATTRTSSQKLFARQGFLLVMVAALLLEATSLIQAFYSAKGLRAEADHRAQSELEISRLKIEQMTSQVEHVTQSTAWALEEKLSDPDLLYQTVQRMMDENPVILNGFPGFKPHYYPEKGRWYEQVLSRWGEGNHYEILTFTSESHDYLSSDWYNKALETGQGYWSEPYFDKDGVSTMVVTYAVPLRAPEGDTVGVFGVDVSLAWLTDIVSAVQPYEDSFGTIESGKGQLIAMPAETLTVEKALRYNAPIQGTGWTMSLVIPIDEVYGDMRRVFRQIAILQLLGLLILVIILRHTAIGQMRLEKVEAGKQRLEDELKIASAIQMAMVPRTFPPFPERNDLDMAADIDPAKEVGGDLYDYYIQDEKLYFCIGDVSGKGVPAALVMAVTRSLFRSESHKSESPAQIVSAMNEAMSVNNDNNMFVTFFCGILDLKTGHLRYCNAGHNAPVVLTKDKQMLPVMPNLPLAVLPGMVFQEQETDLHYDDALFLYTDGLTEAENMEAELFGEKRMLAALSDRKAAIEHLRKLQDAVHEFVGEAPQSDDLTMLFIHFLKRETPLHRHLRIPNDVQKVPLLADFVEEVAQASGIDPALSMSLNLALEEAVTNVVLYAYPDGTEGEVDIDASLREGCIQFTVTDRGKAFDPTAKEDPDVSLGVEDRPIGGLGIFLVKQIMDQVKYRRDAGKNYLIMTKNI